MKFSWSLIKNLISSRGNCAQNHDIQSWKFTLRKLAFNLSVYNKYGLYTHDIIDYDDPVVREVLRRLPKDVLDARNFRRFSNESTQQFYMLCRIIRASQLNFLKIYLPREKWVTYEQDIKYRYLNPYVKEIQNEQAEINEFGCHNYKDSDWPAGEVK